MQLQPIQLQFSDLVDFVLLNKGDTFKEYNTEEQIAWMLKAAIDKGLLYYSINEMGYIDGLIVAEKREEEEVLFVIENLSMTLKNLKKFAARAKEEFKGYKLEWFKHGIHKKHNTEHVWKKLCTPA